MNQHRVSKILLQLYIRHIIFTLVTLCNTDPFMPRVHLAWKKGSVAEGQLLISHFSIKLHFLSRLEIDR